MGQKEMVMIAAGECWRSRSLGVFMACLIETAGDATAVSVLLSFALTAVLAQGAASAVCFRGELRPITGLSRCRGIGDRCKVGRSAGMIAVRRDAVRTQGRAPKGGGDQRDREAVGSSSRLEARFRSRRGCQMRHFCHS